MMKQSIENSILKRIVAEKQKTVAHAKKHAPLSGNNQAPLPTRDFIGALANTAPAIIAEIKQASPSRGILRDPFDVAELARTYEKHGAACLSVLTDEPFFQGHPDDLMMAKNATSCPILRKDFIIDPYQITESLVLGADCILLIVAILEDSELWDFCEQAQGLGMAVLVESHTAQEFERALRLPTPLMGINNRDLNTFETTLDTTITLADDLPPGKCIVTESGIRDAHDIQRMQSHGITRFLIGESLLQAQDIGAQLERLIHAGA